MRKEKIKVTESSGNVFLTLVFLSDEAAILAMSSELMCQLDSPGMLITLATRAGKKVELKLAA